MTDGFGEMMKGKLIPVTCKKCGKKIGISQPKNHPMHRIGMHCNKCMPSEETLFKN